MKSSTQTEKKYLTEKEIEISLQTKEMELRNQMKTAITSEELKIRTTEFLKTLQWKK